MDASGWSSIIGSVTQGAADIISSTKGNYSKNATSFGIGVGTAQNSASGTASLLPVVGLGIVAFMLVKLFKK